MTSWFVRQQPETMEKKLFLFQRADIYTEHKGRSMPGAAGFKRNLSFDFQVLNLFQIRWSTLFLEPGLKEQQIFLIQKIEDLRN